MGMNNESAARVGEETEVCEQDQWLTIKEACLQSGCSHMTIRRRIWDRAVEAVFSYGEWLVSKNSLEAHKRKVTQQRLDKREKLKPLEAESYGTFKLIDGGYQKIK